MIETGTPIPTPSNDLYINKVGVFEGGGYANKGVYRPMVNCRMNRNDAIGFCDVCRKAIEDMLKFYTD
jgi:hypothetical protein